MPTKTDEADTTPLGRHLRAIRDAEGWSLAEAAKKTSMSAAWIGQVERGERPHPTRRSLIRMAHGYDVPPGDLLAYIGETYEERPRGQRDAPTHDELAGRLERLEGDVHDLRRSVDELNAAVQGDASDEAVPEGGLPPPSKQRVPARRR